MTSKTKSGQVTDEVRLFVTQALACFDSPTTITEAVKNEFGVQMTRQAVEGYDPGKVAGKNLSPRWRKVFEVTREAFLKDIAKIGIAHRAVRLRMLERAAILAESRGNTVHMAELLEQAAKECGDFYTNKHIHNVKATGNLTVELVQFEDDDK